MFSVLRRVATELTLPKTNEVLKELRDLSLMAIEHFDEVVAPLLKDRAIAIAGGVSNCNKIYQVQSYVYLRTQLVKDGCSCTYCEKYLNRNMDFHRRTSAVV